MLDVYSKNEKYFFFLITVATRKNAVAFLCFCQLFFSCRKLLSKIRLDFITSIITYLRTRRLEVSDMSNKYILWCDSHLREQCHHFACVQSVAMPSISHHFTRFFLASSTENNQPLDFFFSR